MYYQPIEPTTDNKQAEKEPTAAYKNPSDLWGRNCYEPNRNFRNTTSSAAVSWQPITLVNTSQELATNLSSRTEISLQTLCEILRLRRIPIELKALTLLKQANTRGTESLGPSTPGMKSMRGPIQLNGLTMENSTPFSAPSAATDDVFCWFCLNNAEYRTKCTYIEG